MSDERDLVTAANSYSPQSLNESHQPQGSSEPPKTVPKLVSGVATAAPAAAPVQNNAPAAQKARE